MSFQPPAVVEIRIKHKGQEIVITKTQAKDSAGRFTETVADTVRSAAGDAQAWIRRQR